MDTVMNLNLHLERAIAYKIEGDLRKEVGANQKHYKETGTWRGNRLARRLPVKEQNPCDAMKGKGLLK